MWPVRFGSWDWGGMIGMPSVWFEEKHIERYVLAFGFGVEISLNLRNTAENTHAHIYNIQMEKSATVFVVVGLYKADYLKARCTLNICVYLYIYIS